MCSPISQFSGHFLLLDIGNPMKSTCVEIIRKSLLDILSLASFLKGASTIPVFGCGVVEPNLIILQEWKFLKGNYIEIQDKLENIENSLKVGIKCSFGDFKHSLEESVLKIVADFELKRNNWKLKTSVKEQLNPKEYWPNKIVITLITKKSAFPIQKMLEDVSSCSEKLEKIDIVEITSLEDDIPRIMTDNLNSVSCSIVSENVCDLDAVFKKWIMEDKSGCEQLIIVLDKRSVHHIQCELGCFIDPENMNISQSSLQTGFSHAFPSYDHFILKGVKNSTCELNVINKLKISDVCPSKLFGLPKTMYATRSRNLRVAELRFNTQLFKALCTQLFKEQIGLLTKTGPDINEITAFHFIVSDGDKLLIRNVVPAELQLPPRPEISKTSSPDNEDANFVVHSLLDQIETGEEISPDKCSAGIYEHMRKYLKSEEVEIRMKFEHFQNEKCRKIKETTSTKTSIPPGEYTPKLLMDLSLSNQKCSQNKKIRKSRKDSGYYSQGKKCSDEVIHPALLPPETTVMSRKSKVQKFLLPELSVPGVLEK